MKEAIVISPIGVVHCTRKEPIDDDWLRERGEIELDSAQFSPESLAGIDASPTC